MPKPTQTKGQVRPVQLVLIAATPLALAIVQVALRQAPAYFLWLGGGLSLLTFLLARLLSGFALFGRRRLQFGKATPLRAWQAPVLWLAVAISAVVLVFWRFAT